jgi:hypothetical protein
MATASRKAVGACTDPGCGVPPSVEHAQLGPCHVHCGGCGAPVVLGWVGAAYAVANCPCGTYDALADAHWAALAA